MVSTVQEEVKSKDGQYFQKIMDISRSQTSIVFPISVIGALEPLDCVSRCLWMSVYALGCFGDGEATIPLAEFASMLNISRSSLETKISNLVKKEYLIKSNNYDKKKREYSASTYYVRLPDDTLERISQEFWWKEIVK